MNKDTHEKPTDGREQAWGSVTVANRNKSVVPVFRPSLWGKPTRLLGTLASGWWGTGPAVREFESRIAGYLNIDSERCVMVNSCTAALHLAVKLAPAVKRFFVPTITFVSTALAARYEGRRVTFTEVNDDLCIDQDWVLDRVQEGDGVIAVHMGGQVADLSRLRDRVVVIEDCAHALGSFDGPRHVGTRGTGCFSFQATKGLPLGDGGILVTPYAGDRARAEALAWCGIDKTTWARSVDGYAWRYDVDEIGYKYRANDVVAALGLDQLPGLSTSVNERASIAATYTSEFEDLYWLTLPVERGGTLSNWQEFIVRTRYRDGLAAHLENRGIATTVHYHPIHLYRPFWEYDDGLVAPASLPRSEALSKEILTIPCFAGMSDEERERVVDGVRSFRP